MVQVPILYIRAKTNILILEIIKQIFIWFMLTFQNELAYSSTHLVTNKSSRELGVPVLWGENEAHPE